MDTVSTLQSLLNEALTSLSGPLQPVTELLNNVLGGLLGFPTGG